MPVDGAEAHAPAPRELARKEGIFVGISGGATFAGALAVCAQAARPGANILCMLPDTGERYLSTPLFADIPADMTDGGDRDLALDAGPAVPELSVSPSSAPIPRFASYRGTLVCEPRNQRSTSNSMILVRF